MPDASIETTLRTALRHHQAGELQPAETLYRQILAAKPNHAEALHLLGVVASQSGALDSAIALIRRAIAAKAGQPAWHSNLAHALFQTGRADEAVAASREALRLDPTFADAYNNLGNALRSRGSSEDASKAFREAIRLQPGHAEARNNLGNLLQEEGDRPAAIAEFRQAVEIQPDFIAARYNLGNALREAGMLEEAIVAHEEVVRLVPTHADAWNNLGAARSGVGQLDQAIAAYHEALRLRPEHFDASSNLGNVLRMQGRMDEALEIHEKARKSNPQSPASWINLGADYSDQGLSTEALRCYGRALELAPARPEIHSQLLYTSWLDPELEAPSILALHRDWDRRHAQPLARFIRPHTRSAEPNRPLRIGYLSPDFRDHAVGHNLLPLLRAHNRREFEIYGYSNAMRTDEVTSRFPPLLDGWRNIWGVADADAVEMIRADRIDILVDLSLHTAGNRLLLLARKPAPIQACYLGHNGTTGVGAIDYRMSDPYLDPPGSDLTCHSEKTVRLPHCTWCYEPGGPMPEITSLPALDAGFVTFICRNNFAKVSPPVLDAWAKILGAIPKSRLLLTAPEGSSRKRVLGHFAKEDVSPDRVEFTPFREPWQSFIDSYTRADIALDPFPYGGWITTCDALWMGVPVVSLSGKTAVGRGGRSILYNLGLPDLVAENPRQYIDIAISLAGDRHRLTELRSSLRERMQNSPLRDPVALARGIESSYHEMWWRWCAGSRD